ncbi:unnamed protein product [Orchesella dallaii]
MGARKATNDKETDVQTPKSKGQKGKLNLVDKQKMKATGKSKVLVETKVKKSKASLNSKEVEKEKLQTKSTTKPEDSKPSTSTTGRKSTGCSHSRVSKSRRYRRPGRPRRRCCSEDESGSETDHEGGLTPESAEQVYSATYVEDYIDSIEHLDGVARSTSRIVENHCELLGFLKEMGSELQQFVGEDEDNLDLDNLSQRQKDAVSKMEHLLQQSQCLGDSSTHLSQDVADAIDEKFRILKIDTENLDRVMGNNDNRTPKKGAPNLKKVSINPEPLKSSAVRSLGSFFDSGCEQSVCVNSDANTSTASGEMFNFDESLLEGCTRYRTCKFKNPPQYVPSTRPSMKTQTPSSQEKNSSTSTEEKIDSAKKEGGLLPKKSSSTTSIRTGNSVANSVSVESDNSTEEEESSSDEPTYCLCDKESSGRMVGCDNHLCPIEWFHFKCVGLKTKPKGKWFCPKCRGEDSTVMKPRKVFLAELQRYNKEKEKDL